MNNIYCLLNNFYCYKLKIERLLIKRAQNLVTECNVGILQGFPINRESWIDVHLNINANFLCGIIEECVLYIKLCLTPS